MLRVSNDTLVEVLGIVIPDRLATRVTEFSGSAAKDDDETSG